MSGLATLSSADLAEFHRVQRRLGLGVDQLSHSGHLSTADHGGNLVLSADPGLSDIEPLLVPYRSIAELKAMIGRPDSDYTDGPFSDRHIAYPADLHPDRAATLLSTQNGCDFDYQATDDEAAVLRHAAQCYVMGNSQKVKGFEPLLDARFAPATLAVIAGDVLNVGSGEKVTIKPDAGDPDKILYIHYSAINVDPGGQIVVEAPVQIKTITFTAVD